MTEFLIFGFAFAATATGVALIRRIGPSTRLIDIPNDRSSHEVPTVRGGGLAIVIVCLALYALSGSLGLLSINWFFIAGGLIVAGISFTDDLFSLPAWIRLAVHAFSALVLIVGSSPIERLFIPVADTVLDLGLVTYAVYFIWIVWMINAFNFMDGIDGIAGAQGAVAGLGWTGVGLLLGDPGIYLLGGVIALSCLGFLIHNWRPAAIFMGDVGSAFVGFTLASMPSVGNDGSHQSGWLFIAALTFLWLFFVDTVYTFTRRALRGERVWKAHREHLYQRMVIVGVSHSRVALLYAALGVLNSAAFFVVFWGRGKFGPLLLFSYLVTSVIVIVAASRKNH